MLTTTTSGSTDKEIILNGIYSLKKKIGSGSFGVVYQALNKKTGEMVAAKIEKNDDKDSCSILYEATCLSRVQGLKGFPKLHWSGSTATHDAMVVCLLGRDIGSYVKIFKKFSLKTVVCLLDQLIGLLEHMHNRNLVHRDIKPENMTLGKGEDSNIVHLIDFGISKLFRDDNGRHISYRENKPFIGTTRYASVAAHRGIEISRKDDLESLGYVCLFMLKGALPWQNMNVKEKEKNKKVGEMKSSLPPEKLCEDLPPQFKTYFSYIRSLKFTQEPDYLYLRGLLQEVAASHKFEINTEYDWSRPLKLAVKPYRSEVKKLTANIAHMGEGRATQQNANQLDILLKPPELPVSRSKSPKNTLVTVATNRSMVPSIMNFGGTRGNVSRGYVDEDFLVSLDNLVDLPVEKMQAIEGNFLRGFENPLSRITN